MNIKLTKTVINCNKGWECLYQPIIDKIIEHDLQVSDVKDKIGIAKIKEKYGLLTICLYHQNNASEEIMNMIIEATRKSKQICEYCGTTQHVGTTRNNWFKTCCKSCWEKNIKNINTDSVWVENL